MEDPMSQTSPSQTCDGTCGGSSTRPTWAAQPDHLIWVLGPENPGSLPGVAQQLEGTTASEKHSNWKDSGNEEQGIF